jgi:GT2 family glycosyltransferase
MGIKHPFVVIPNWNGADLIRACLDSLAVQSQDHQVIVVDNGSTDGSPEIIAREYPDVQLIRLSRNYGFAGGVNRGIEAAMSDKAEYIALLNNDAVANENWLKYLVEAAEGHPEAGIVTAKILDQTGEYFDSTGDFYSIYGLPFPRGRGEKDLGQYDKPEEVFAASGGASLYNAAMLKQIGLFDEDFFAYYEDVDISFRAQLAGWRVRYEPRAVVHHHTSSTSSRMGKSHGKSNTVTSFARYHTVKNFNYLYLKNMPGWLFLKYLPHYLLGYALMFAHDLVRANPWTFLRADWRAATTLLATWRKRRAIQRSRKASVRYIDSILYHHMSPLALTSLRRRIKNP